MATSVASDGSSSFFATDDTSGPHFGEGTATLVPVGRMQQIERIWDDIRTATTTPPGDGGNLSDRITAFIAAVQMPGNDDRVRSGLRQISADLTDDDPVLLKAIIGYANHLISQEEPTQVGATDENRGFWRTCNIRWIETSNMTAMVYLLFAQLAGLTTCYYSRDGCKEQCCPERWGALAGLSVTIGVLVTAVLMSTCYRHCRR